MALTASLRPMSGVAATVLGAGALGFSRADKIGADFCGSKKSLRLRHADGSPSGLAVMILPPEALHSCSCWPARSEPELPA
jgi:hypothetical protein